MNCSVLLVMTLLDSAYFYASGKTLMGSESMIFSCSSNILYWSALLSFARPSKQLLNPFCLFIFYFIFVSAGKDLNLKDIRNRSHILAHTHTHTRLKPEHTSCTFLTHFVCVRVLRACAGIRKTRLSCESFDVVGGGEKKTNKQAQRYGEGVLTHAPTHKCARQSPSKLRISPAHPCCFASRTERKESGSRARGRSGVEKVSQRRHVTLSPTSVSNCCPPSTVPPPECTLQPKVGPSPFRRIERPASLSNEVEWLAAFIKTCRAAALAKNI